MLYKRILVALLTTISILSSSESCIATQNCEDLPIFYDFKKYDCYGISYGSNFLDGSYNRKLIFAGFSLVAFEEEAPIVLKIGPMVSQSSQTGYSEEKLPETIRNQADHISVNQQVLSLNFSFGVKVFSLVSLFLDWSMISSSETVFDGPDFKETKNQNSVLWVGPMNHSSLGIDFHLWRFFITYRHMLKFYPDLNADKNKDAVLNESFLYYYSENLNVISLTYLF